MKILSIASWIFILLFAGTALHAQKLMLIEKRKSLKNYKYYPGEDIRLKVKPDGKTIEGEIICLTDSTVCIDQYKEVPFDDIMFIYRKSSIMRITSGALLLGGVAYWSLDSFNRLINNDSPVILAETTAISGGMIGAGLLLLPLKYQRINAQKCRISMLDFDEFKLFPD